MVRLAKAAALAVVAIALYLAAAAWLRHSYVDPVPKGRIVVHLKRPFERNENAFICRCAGELDAFADDETIKGDARSPVLLYEDGKLLGPAHSTFQAIRDLGAGRFSHLRRGFVFSSSDNADPATNERRYWAVVP
jgi:hypothetical protein